MKPIKPNTETSLVTLPLDELAQWDTSALKPVYQRLFKRPPPGWASVKFMRSNIAWALQAKAQGHDPLSLRASLLKQAQESLSHLSGKPTHNPGTRLIREWQGQVYEVVVTENGYVWKDKTYKSLSPIATAITGTRWSGPRFFGLNNKSLNPQRKKRSIAI